MFIVLMILVSWWYTYVKIFLRAQFKYVQYILYQLYDKLFIKRQSKYSPFLFSSVLQNLPGEHHVAFGIFFYIF